MKRELESFGDKERGHMFGVGDNGGEEWNSKARQRVPH